MNADISSASLGSLTSPQAPASQDRSRRCPSERLAGSPRLQESTPAHMQSLQHATRRARQRLSKSLLLLCVEKKHYVYLRPKAPRSMNRNPWGASIYSTMIDGKERVSRWCSTWTWLAPKLQKRQQRRRATALLTSWNELPARMIITMIEWSQSSLCKRLYFFLFASPFHLLFYCTGKMKVRPTLTGRSLSTKNRRGCLFLF